MVSSIFKNGEGYIATLLDHLLAWMQEKEYVSIKQMKGNISLQHMRNPVAYQRANYMRILTDYRY